MTYIFLDYIFWHYQIAPKEIFGILKNYLTGNWHKFLITKHLKTLFYPWHRLRPSEIEKTNKISEKIANAIIDFYIRILAALVRLTIVLTGLIYELITIIIFLALFLIWLFWPVVFIYLIVKGLTLIF